MIDGHEALDFIKAARPDAALIEYAASDRFRAFRACNKIRENLDVGPVPVILLSRKPESSQEQLEALREGAHLWLDIRDASRILPESIHALVRLRRSDERTLESEERFQLFVRNVQDYAIVMLDPAGHIETWNPGAIHLFGFTAQEAVGQPSRILFPKEELEKNRPDWELNTARTQGRALDQNWLARKDGSKFWADGVLIALRTESGEIRGFAKIVQDKSADRNAEIERERLLLELAEQKSFLENVMRLMPAGIRISEAPSGNTLFHNEEAKRLVGEDVAGASLNEMPQAFGALHADGTPLKADEYPAMRTIKTGEIVLGEELKIKRNDGPTRTLSVYTSPIRNPDGRVIAAVTLLFDVSKQKKTEEELQQAIQVRDEFLSVASHELNTPLQSFLLNLQLLQKKFERREGGSVPTEEVLVGIRPAVAQVQRLSRMLSALLDVSRIRNKRLNLDIDVFDLCDAAQEIVNRLMPQAKSTGTEIRLKACPHVVGYWDRMRIEQVLTNLLSNAIKYGEGRPVDIELESKDDTATIHVMDRGIGIAQGDLQRIFERFERASVRAKNESLGLGLFIVKQIVEAHGGTISVKSEPEKGSTFTVRLPLRRMQSHAASADVNWATDEPVKDAK